VSFVDALPYVAVAVGAVVVTALTMYLMLGPKKGETPVVDKTPSESKPSTRWPFATEHSVSAGEAKEAREKLRTLELEREILSDAIRRLYEAQVEGKITEQERDTLAESYKSRMLKVKDAITKSQSVVALQELESMQEDLIKLFDDRFDELNSKIEDMRSKVEIKTEKEEPEIPVAIEAPEEEEELTETSETGSEQKQVRRIDRKPRPRAAATPEKTEAEKRVDQIRAEVEKVLERLGQMESEA
jgi:hypothetical protein